MKLEIIYIIQFITNLSLIVLILFKKSILSYFNKKGENLATKQDIADITNKIEEVKLKYNTDIESIKLNLNLQERKHNLLIDEKIRVFKKIQKNLVDFKKYCKASIGSFGNVSEFHITRESIEDDILKSSLEYLTLISEIRLYEFIFLSEESRSVIDEFLGNCSMMCSMELAIAGDEGNKNIQNSTIPVYKKAIEDIDRCLESLYQDLEFPNKK